jgi:hypothetical protein
MSQIGNQVTDTRTVDSRWRWLCKVTGRAALGEGIVLLVGMLILIAAVLVPRSASGWLSAFRDNWLITIFKLHAGFGGAQIGLLQGLDLLDLVILALEGLTVLGLYAALWRTSRIWSIVAAIQPFLGIVLFVATKTAGRSAAMGAALVISLVMLQSSVFKKATAYLGVAANTFLLIGDFSAGIPSLPIIATLFGIAYALFTLWFFLIARRLLQLGQDGQGRIIA